MERVPIITPEIIDLLEASETPLPDGLVITVDLPNEFLKNMSFFCQNNPTQLPYDFYEVATVSDFLACRFDILC